MTSQDILKTYAPVYLIALAIDRAFGIERGKDKSKVLTLEEWIQYF